jgi:hypothetical protein
MQAGVTGALLERPEDEKVDQQNDAKSQDEKGQLLDS